MNLSILEAMMSFFIHIIAWMLCIGAFVLFLGIVFYLFASIWNIIIIIVSLFYPKAKKLEINIDFSANPLKMLRRW